MSPDTKSHVIYTEDDVVRIRGRDLVLILTLVAVSSLLMYFVSPVPYLLFLLVSSVGIMLFRARYLLLYMKELRDRGRVTFIPRKSTAGKRNSEDYGFLMAEIFLPLVLLFLLPIPINLVATIGFVVGIPLSLLLEGFLVKGIESHMQRRVKKFFTWTVVNDDLYLKEYGYLTKPLSGEEEKH